MSGPFQCAYVYSVIGGTSVIWLAYVGESMTWAAGHPDTSIADAEGSLHMTGWLIQSKSGAESAYAVCEQTANCK